MMAIIMSPSALISLLVICGLSICVKSSPIVEIKNGLLEGTTMQSRYGREFYSFQGIPYAIPPLGKLRFEPPQPAVSWTGIRKSINVPPKCTQKDVFTNQKIVDGQEDCLYLNVYTPELKNSDDKNLPVMVWIHGGAFISGQGFAFGPKYLLDHNIVLVTLNYRLGAIGFLSTGDMVSPGNIGMKDQVLALKWVQENIAAFGGDPNSVTIFGESAGGASVHYHMLSPLSKGLFHRVISQSGVTLSPWAFGNRNTVKQHSQLLAQHFGCHTNDSTQIIACLRKIDAAEIIEAEKIFQIFGYDPIIPFRIVDEPNHSEAFINDLPLNIVKSGNISDVPWMTGITTHEGAIRVAALLHGFGERSYVKQLNDNWLELGPTNLLLDQVFSDSIPAGVVEKIRQFYFGDKTIDESSKWALIDMYTDIYMAYGIDEAIKYHLEFNSSPIYYYEFAYKGATSFSTIFGDPEGTYGVCHADDLLYLFPIGEILFPKNVLTENDHKIIDFLTTAWYNFAKTGNPTIKDMPVEWKPVTTDAHEYLFIENPQNIKMSSNLNKKRIEFLRSLINQSENFNEKISKKDEL